MSITVHNYYWTRLNGFMILLDFSAIMHQSIFSAISAIKPKLVQGEYNTKDFIQYAKYRLLEEILNVQSQFSSYGDLVICLDDHSKRNWRKEIYSNYKGSRKGSREKSPIKYNEVFSEIDSVLEFLKRSTPFKMIKTESAEGDDVILCLAKCFAKKEKIMIISSDKDMLQAKKYGDVSQYSLFTRKYVTEETKHEDSVDDWILDHVIFGDACDEVPKVVDETEFSDQFTDFLNSEGKKLNILDFNYHLTESQKNNLIDNFYHSKFGLPIKNTSKAKNAPETVLPSIFKKERFGKSNLKKQIKSFGSLDAWLDSNKLYRLNFERNKKLVLSDYIPDSIFKSVIKNYNEQHPKYNNKEFREYILDNHFDNLLDNLPSNFSCKLTLDDLI